MVTWQQNQKTEKNHADKKPSVVGATLSYMYKPRIGRNINEIGRTLGVFPRLLAHIFAAQRLFPLQHPALRDDSMRLTMREVIGTAYGNLSWDKSGLPKIFFFFAIVASLGFSVIAFAYVFMGFFAGPAHAGIFDNVLGPADMSNSWLTYLFQTDIATPNFTVQVPVNTANGTVAQVIGNNVPVAFRTMAAMYSTAMLLLAALILIYHLISMVVATAHDGRVMGKSAHQVWAPVRLIFALGLLIPLANGFSSGQWLVLQIAKLGSNLATNVWTDPNVGQRVVGNPSVLTSQLDTEIGSLIDNLIRIGYCGKNVQLNGTITPNMDFLTTGGAFYTARTPGNAAFFADVNNALAINVAAANPQLNAVTGVGGRVPQKTGAGLSARPGAFSKDYYPVGPDGVGNYVTTNGIKSCGSVEFPTMNADGAMAANDPAFKAVLDAFEDAHIAGFNAIEANALQVGAVLAAAQREGADCFATYPTALGVCASPNPAINLANAKNQLRADYYAAFSGSPFPGGVAINPDGKISFTTTPAGAQLTALVGGMGWMGAAGFFSGLASKHNVFSKTGQMLPRASCGQEADETNGQEANGPECGEAVIKAQEQREQKNAPAATKDFGSSGGVITDFFLGMFKPVAKMVNLADNNGNYIWHTRFTSPSPVSDMISLGNSLIDGALYSLLIGVVLNLGGAVGTFMKSLGSGGALRGNAGGSATGWVASKLLSRLPSGAIARVVGAVGGGMLDMLAMAAPLFFGLATMMFLPGIFLFYLLPFLPFINFVTGVITWLISLLQAVVAIPVIAIAHITPHGEGLPSGSARGAYTMILQIFLRPVMMIFGLLVAVVIMNTGIGFLNNVFFNIYKVNMAGAADGLLSNVVFMGLYTAGCWGIVNAAITAIDDFPLNAVKWIGGGSVDRNHDFSGVSQAVVGAVAAQGMSAVSNAARGISSMPNQMLNSAGNANTSVTQQRALTDALAQRGGGNMPSAGPAGSGAMTPPTGPGGSGGTGAQLPPGYTTSPGGVAVPNSAGGGPRSPMTQATMEAHREGRAMSDVQTRQTFGATGPTGTGSGSAGAQTGGSGTGGAASQGTAPFPGSSSRTASTPGGNVQPGARDAIRAAGNNNAPAAAQRGQIEVPQSVGGGARSQSQQATMEALRTGRPVTLMTDRDAIINRVIDKYEGGARLVTDSGGLTKYGISQNAYPNLDIRNLTREQAVEIYKRDYWNRIGGDRLAPEMRLMAFDTAVNQGVGRANDFLNRSGGDVEAFTQLRANHYQSLAESNPQKYGQYLNGWMNRLGDVFSMSTGGGTMTSAAPGGIDPGAGAETGGGSSGGGFSGAAHTVLGLASFIPGVSIVAGGLDAIIYTAEGDYGNAALAGVSMIPGGKWGTSGFKLVRWGAKMAKGAGSMARLDRGMSALSGGNSGGGGMAAPVDTGFDPYTALMMANAARYIAKGKRGTERDKPQPA